MLPQQSHPLTLAYIAGTKAHTHDEMRRCIEIIRSIEQSTSEIVRAQCKLVAEILIERQMA